MPNTKHSFSKAIFPSCSPSRLYITPIPLPNDTSPLLVDRRFLPSWTRLILLHKFCRVRGFLKQSQRTHNSSRAKQRPELSAYWLVACI